jgi:hypothetical protein
MQATYPRQIDETFGAEVLTRVPEFERDITGLEMLRRTAEHLFVEPT